MCDEIGSSVGQQSRVRSYTLPTIFSATRSSQPQLAVFARAAHHLEVKALRIHADFGNNLSFFGALPLTKLFPGAREIFPLTLVVF